MATQPYQAPARARTAESVCAGHPDKICDRISDAILDAVLAQDPHGRVAVEALATEGQVVLAGEIRTTAAIDPVAITRAQIRQLGYTDPRYRFTDGAAVTNLIHEQSAEIAVGVDTGGAGDQGLMIGYACDETPQRLPLPIALAHDLARALDTARQTSLPYLRPDGKSQVTLEETGDKRSVTAIVLAVPHAEDIATPDVKADLIAHVVTPVLARYHLDPPADIIVNGTGIWHLGGPAFDTGLTGRKIVVDAYGGEIPVGGGAFSGKDPSKVDRSGAYAARYLATNLVAHGLASRAQVRLAYVIGQPRPVMRAIDTFGTATVAPAAINDFTDTLLDLSAQGIIRGLGLNQPIYALTSAYGHFGRSIFPWENVKTHG